MTNANLIARLVCATSREFSIYKLNVSGIIHIHPLKKEQPETRKEEKKQNNQKHEEQKEQGKMNCSKRKMLNVPLVANRMQFDAHVGVERRTFIGFDAMIHVVDISTGFG